MADSRIIKIFLASSSELKEDREQFEIFINRKNKEYIRKRIFLELVIWEDFLNAMSPSRLQDEYNKAILYCDIFVGLFYTKIGKYIEEKFLKAIETFKENQKPIIYTYFKDSPIVLSQITSDINSLLEFKSQLSDRGHFSTTYRNINELKYHFDKQLNKIIPKLTNLALVTSRQFDVFLCHNPQDRPEVIKIARQFQQQGLKPWLDIWELPPGISRQELLEEQIEQIKSAAVFIGKGGLGPWQKREIEAFLRDFIERGAPVIPVLLEDAPKKPKLPILFQSLTWVDFRHENNPMERLIWGITGSKLSPDSLKSLKQAERQENFQMFLNELSSPRVEHRIRAFEALEKIELVNSDIKVAVSKIIEAISDNDKRVRIAAVKALGQIGEKANEGVPALIATLQDSDLGVRKNAAKALGEIGNNKALSALNEALNETTIRDIVNTAILKISLIQEKKLVHEQKLQEKYSVWFQQIRQSLYDSNSVSIANFPDVHRSFIIQKLRKDLAFLNLIFHQDTVTFEVSERDRINGFSEVWKQTKIAMQQHKISKFREETDRLTLFLCQALNFKLLEHNSATQGQFYGRIIDASNPAFQLNIRPSFPLIYICKIESSEKDACDISGILNQFGIYADFFALLIIFNNYQEIRQQVRDSPFKNDFIVLNYDQLWDILAAKSPIQQLTNCILEQIDLIAISPYTVFGPVNKKMFFGRAKEEKTLLQNIGRNDYALIANRKMGKTSLLNRIYPRLQKIPKYQIFYCDLQPVRNYVTFYKKLALSNPELKEDINNFSELSPLSFEELIGKIRQRNSNRQIIFIFDEVDEILTYDVQEKEQLFKTFRSLSQRENIRFIFSGTTILVKRVRHPDSPLFNFCSPIKIGILEEKAAYELVIVPMKTLGIKFENETATVQRILDLTAQHPNIIQYTCDALIQRINEKQERKITEQDLDKIADSQEFYEYFESLIWGQSTALEKLIVCAMWSYPEFTESEVIEEFKHRELSVEGVKASLEILLTYSTLSKKNDKYYFTFGEFAKLMEKRRDIKALTEQYKREVRGSEA